MADDRSRDLLLVLSQVYVPDPASVGQHMADAAAAMVRRGYRVVVLTSGRGYDDPSVKYPAREVIDGVEVHRLPLASFGKRSLLVRLIGALSFVFQCVLRGLLMPRPRCILVSTSPPMCSLAALLIAAFRRVPIKYWVMDLNPDQMIALGRIRERSLPARLFDLLNRAILTRARAVIVLDRFMLERVNRKADIRKKVTVLPPWPHDDHLESIPHERNSFRQAHDLSGKFVIMYSGNLSLASPITTVLEAALRLQDEKRLVFVLIGGGLGKRQLDDLIERERPNNMLSLPYQPLSQIKYSLSAADVHLVSMGDPMAGIIHPCKVYGAMAVARPILFLGPATCHISELLDRSAIGWQIRHGDIEGAVRTIREILNTAPAELAARGERAKRVVSEQFGKELLITRFCDVVEPKP